MFHKGKEYSFIWCPKTFGGCC